MELQVTIGCDEEGIFKAIVSTPCPIPEHTENMAPLRWDFPDTNPYRYTERRRRSGFLMMWFILTGCLRGLIVDMERLRNFAVESAVNELAAELGMDPAVLREKNMVRPGDVMPAYYGEEARSCVLDRCVNRVKR